MTTRARIATFVDPLAAAAVGVVLWIVAWRVCSISLADGDLLFRVLPFASRFDARYGALVALLAAALVVLPRGRAQVWVRRAIGAAGVAALGYATYVVATAPGDELWLTTAPLALVDGGLLAAASAYLLVRREPTERRPWRGLAATALLLAGSAAGTMIATRPTAVYSGDELANVHVSGYFMVNHPFEPASLDAVASPSAVPRRRLNLDRGTMMCGGEWHVVAFADDARCLPIRALVSFEPGDVERIEVGPQVVGGRPAMLLRLRDRASAEMAAAIHAARDFHLVLVNARGELVSDAAVWSDVPGPDFVIENLDVDKTLQAILGRTGRVAAAR